MFILADSQFQSGLHDVATLGRSEGLGTLTGRIPLWEALWEESQGYQWKGFGFGAFWSVDRSIRLHDYLKWYPRHSHSAYMHVFLDLGVVGLLLVLSLAVTCLAAAMKAYRQTRDPAYKFFFGLLMAGLLDGFIEISYVSPRELGLFVGIAIMGLIVIHPSRRPRSSSQADSELGRVVSNNGQVLSSLPRSGNSQTPLARNT